MGCRAATCCRHGLFCRPPSPPPSLTLVSTELFLVLYFLPLPTSSCRAFFTLSYYHCGISVGQQWVCWSQVEPCVSSTRQVPSPPHCQHLLLQTRYTHRSKANPIQSRFWGNCTRPGTEVCLDSGYLFDAQKTDMDGSRFVLSFVWW